MDPARPSSLTTRESPATVAGTLLGMLAYMAPEQLEGRDVDARSIAELEIKRALDLNPSSASAHSLYAYYLVALGRFDEAIAERTHQRVLEPNTRVSYQYSALTYMHACRYDEALDQQTKARDLDPRAANAHATLAWILGRIGRTADSLHAGERRAIRAVDCRQNGADGGRAPGWLLHDDGAALRQRRRGEGITRSPSARAAAVSRSSNATSGNGSPSSRFR